MAALVEPDSPPISEVSPYRPEEIPLFAAIALVEPAPWENGRLWLQPGPIDLRELPGRPDLQDEANKTFLSSAVERLIRDSEVPLASFEYGDLGSPEELVRIIDAINISDELLLRGLTKLQSAQHLVQEHFMEEAGLAALISLEAALEMIRRRLEAESGSAKSFQDALKYVQDTFPHGQTLRPYLEELYDLRVITVHPGSRFGDYWTPPMDADHVFETIDELVSLYRHVLLGDLPPLDVA